MPDELIDAVNAVKQLREMPGLSQRDLADLSGVAQSNIAAYESGARRPSAKMLERLRRAAKAPYALRVGNFVPLERTSPDNVTCFSSLAHRSVSRGLRGFLICWS